MSNHETVAPAPKRANIDEVRVGDTATAELIVSARDVETFAALSSDTNRLHMDEGVARGYGFSRPVAHGMLALSAISRLIGTELPGHGSLWVSQTVQFVGPVLVGDRLIARVTVEQVSKATGLVALQTEVVNAGNQTPVLSGAAKVKILQQVESVADRNGETRVAVVTGSSRGLGRAVALALGSSAHVVVHYNQHEACAQAVVGEIAERSGRAVACQADLRTSEGCDQLFQQACDAFGRVDILINSAGSPVVPKPTLDASWSEFECFLNMYVRSAFRMTQLVAPGMQSRRFGRIVNVLCSSAIGVPQPKMGPYVTAKSALAGLSRSLAVELGPFGITVNMVAPSLLVTEQSTALGDRARQLAASQSPMRRLASVDEVAEAARFLTSDAAGYITGVVLPVAGGEIM